MLTSRNPSPNVWFSQIGQDKIVHQLLGNMKGGYFVDLAANDATKLSNSFSLETSHDWNGLCIEANARYWARLAFRKCQVIGAVVGHTRMEEMTFNFGPKAQSNVLYHETFDNGVYGGIVDNGMDNRERPQQKATHSLIKRYTVPLQEIFERHHTPAIIDYFSLDVEGAESFIMSAFPFDQYKFRVLSIERPTDDLKQILGSHKYTFIQNVGRFGETIWAHASELESINKNSIE